MLDVAHYRQQRSWSCGPAVVKMVLHYRDISESEVDLIDALGSTPKDGTSPEAIHALLRNRFRLIARAHRGLCIDALGRLTRNHPVIAAIQAHGPRGTDYAASWDHGHYVCVVGVERGRVILADPSSKRPRISFTESEFLSRWRDLSPDATKRYLQWGLSVGPRKSRKD